eukprot:g4274.t1
MLFANYSVYDYERDSIMNMNPMLPRVIEGPTSSKLDYKSPGYVRLSFVTRNSKQEKFDYSNQLMLHLGLNEIGKFLYVSKYQWFSPNVNIAKKDFVITRSESQESQEDKKMLSVRFEPDKFRSTWTCTTKENEEKSIVTHVHLDKLYVIQSLLEHSLPRLAGWTHSMDKDLLPPFTGGVDDSSSSSGNSSWGDSSNGNVGGGGGWNF